GQKEWRGHQLYEPASFCILIIGIVDRLVLITGSRFGFRGLELVQLAYLVPASIEQGRCNGSRTDSRANLGSGGPLAIFLFTLLLWLYLRSLFRCLFLGAICFWLFLVVCHNQTYPSSRTSVILPFTAAAAAIAGDMRWVLAPGP